MQVKRFTAPTMREALTEVREDMGPDAIILSNRKNKHGVEILCTLDPGAAASYQPPRPAPAEPAPDSGPAASGAESAPGVAAGGRSTMVDAGEWQQLQDELKSMRELMQQQFSAVAWGSFKQQHPGKASMWRRLQRLGLTAPVCRRLLDPLPEILPPTTAWNQLMSALTDSIPTNQEDPIDRGGVFAFVGPTGSGKTTTIGKLAARYVLAHGNDSVVLVTTDCYRIGAHDQLRTLARILNVPMVVCDDSRPLEQVVREQRRARLMLIDTAGLQRDAPQLNDQLDSIRRLGPRAHSLLVLPTTAQAPVIEKTIATYRTPNTAGLVLTKLDETASLGEALSGAIQHAMPVVYSTDGQGIPNDITIGSGKGLVQQAIRLAKDVPADDTRVAEQYATLSGGASADAC